jgi:serine protease Do
MMSIENFLFGDVGDGIAQLVERERVSVVEVRTQGAGAGAGVIWRPDGTIVTNHHVVPRDRVEVRLLDGRAFPATVVGRDPSNDLAVLTLGAGGQGESLLPSGTIGDARELRVGELVLALGHPFGLRHALTIGVVSAGLTPAGTRGGREMVRADVLLGPGNSGGPLLDSRGRVVGINSMVVGGLALAVPSHLADRLVRSAVAGEARAA